MSTYYVACRVYVLAVLYKIGQYGVAYGAKLNAKLNHQKMDDFGFSNNVLWYMIYWLGYRIFPSYIWSIACYVCCIAVGSSHAYKTVCSLTSNFNIRTLS